MKISIVKTEYKQVSTTTDVNVPEQQMYVWHNGIRRAYSIKPQWTTWNMEQNHKPEEIFELLVVMVDPSYNKIEVNSLSVSSLPEIVKNVKHPFNRLVENILNYPNEGVRTKQDFENDLQQVIQKITESV